MNIDTIFSTIFFAVTLIGTGAAYYSAVSVVPHMERFGLKASYISGLSQLIFGLSLLALAIMFNNHGLPKTSGSIVALVIVTMVVVNLHNRVVRRYYNLALR